MFDFLLRPEFQDFVTKLFVALASAFLPYFALRVSVYFQTLTQHLKAKMSSEQQFQLEMLATMAVRAAEQSGFAGYLKDEAVAKRGFAIDFVKSRLAERGYQNVNIDEIVAAIEAAINQGLHRRFDSPVSGGPVEFEMEILDQ